MAILDRISDPTDLRKLSHAELTQLAEEIRRFLVESLSRTGGHLSPNLGVVELTIALHRVFASPRDRIIWDVGHQAYVHKLLTGRKDFSRLRAFGGLSGYPSRAESPHDWVENSHASTSLSYALGHALSNPDYYTVAVIGDGALTGGMAYEALNHIAVARPRRLIIVVNDNGRSYAPTVGGLAMLANLAHLRFDPRYEWAKKTTSRILRGLPIVGETAEELATRFKEAVKQMLEPSTVFDTLGLKYSGRIDGHDLPLLEDTLERAKEFDEPVVVHVVTDKGRGYPPAIADEVDRLHGVGRFDVATGQPLGSELKLTDVVGKALLEAARRREDLVAISAAMISSTGLADMAEEFPDRVIDTGIAEQHAVTLAAGLAMAGKRPVVAIYSTFLQRAFDQIMMDVALHRLPVVFLIDRAGVTGPDGPSHHGVFDLSYLRMIPGLVVGAPSDAAELCAMLETAIAYDGPIAIRYPKAAATSVPTVPADPIPVGEWQERSAGEDVLFLAAGRMVETAEKAAAQLAQRGVSCGVVAARWVKPMDRRLEDWVARYPTVVTLEDNVVTGGFGAAVLERLADTGLADRVRVVGIPDRFLPAGSADDVLASVGLDPDSVADRVVGLLGR
ncbi:MAG: 1-deoxy-D-xylulose-5-phosphate synthase 2 [Acidimicrobiia bacterium]|nr:MAG: 1-deoxy-D-xylulose-5-phosphate synthase 2 [Acidimicrobiia bacterium]